MRQQPASTGSLKLALGLTTLILVVEFAGGLASHSLALLSDSGHVLTDVFALGLAWFALEQSKRPADRRRSYGYQRAGILAALVNAVVLIAIVVAIGLEAARRFAHPQQVHGGIVIAAALFGIAVNGLVIVALRANASGVNLRAALLHVAGDTAGSIGVVAAGVVIVATGWLYIDPLLSVAIAALIAWGAWGIVGETVNLLLEGTPAKIDLDQVRAEILSGPIVTSVHDLHVWALSPEDAALSCHIVVGDCPLEDAEHLVRGLETRLCDRFAIGHTTIQVESCHPCGDILHGAGSHNHPHERPDAAPASS